MRNNLIKANHSNPIQSLRLLGWFVILLIAASVVLVKGLFYLPYLSALLALYMFTTLYKESGDMLDPRAMFFLASFAFVIWPSIGIMLSSQMKYSGYFVGTTRRVIFDRNDFGIAQSIIFGGLVASAVPLVLSRRSAVKNLDVDQEEAPFRAWFVYTGALISLLGFVLYSYGSLYAASVYAFDPIARDLSDVRVISGLYGLIYSVSICSAYYVSSRLNIKLIKSILFIPSILLIQPSANRGLSLIGVLVMAAAMFNLRNRRAFILMPAMLIALPIISVAMLSLRNMALGNVELTLSNAFDNYIVENNMVATMSYIVRLIGSGELNYVYGLDVGLIFLQFVPRFMWPAKPWPLDYRLNDMLGMNYGQVYGTPISIFGGFYINFTPFAYLIAFALFMILVKWIYNRYRSNTIVSVFFATFIVDIVRVGDISREVVSFTVVMVGMLLARQLIMGSRGRRRKTLKVFGT